MRNKVTPWGEIIIDPGHGSLTGNRGILHDENQEVLRNHAHKNWIYCSLEYKDRHREVMSPGTWTELFFLDEATALSAGHRPCALCMRERFNEFKAAWIAGNPEAASTVSGASAPSIDKELHEERLADDGGKVVWGSTCKNLPDGSMVLRPVGDGGDSVYLLRSGVFWLWSPSGYERRDEIRGLEEVHVLTPRSTVNAMGTFIPAIAETDAQSTR